LMQSNFPHHSHLKNMSWPQQNSGEGNGLEARDVLSATKEQPRP
jgi:hypothetical protein